MMRGLAAVALALPILLAGCTDSDGGGDGATTTPPPTTTTPDGNGTEPLTVTLEANVTEGTAPLTVDFTLDADGEAATWTLRGTTENGSTVFEESGTSLPANVTQAFAAGNFTVVANVTDGARSGNASVQILVAPASVAGEQVVFEDDAEGDGSLWTVTSTVFLDCLGLPCAREAGEHTTSWHLVEDVARSGTASWWSDYPSEYITRMTSVPMALPPGAATLSFWIQGDAETNTVDGLDLFVGVGEEFEQVGGHIDTAFEDWTLVEVPLEGYGGQEVQVRLKFTADATCDKIAWPAEGCGEGSGAGYHIDDIRVTAP